MSLTVILAVHGDVSSDVLSGPGSDYGQRRIVNSISMTQYAYGF